MTTIRQRLVSNSLALMINQLTQNGTSLLLSMAIARTVGAYTLGQYSLAFTFYFIFMTISSTGFKSLLTRELARNPEKTSTTLISGSLLQLIFGLVAYATLCLIVLALPYGAATRIICWIVGAALVPYGLSNITEAILQAQEKMHLIAVSTAPIYILRLVVMYVLLRLTNDIDLVGITLVLSEILVLIIEWGLVLRLLKTVALRIDWMFIRDLFNSARTFLAIEGIAVVKTRMQILILSLLAGETVVGLYTAAVQLITPFYLVSQSLVVSTMPTIARSTADDPRLQKLVEKSIAVLLTVAVPMLVVFWFIGGPLLVFLYRNARFNEAALALGIAGLSMLPIAFVRVLGYLLMARGMERVNLRALTINTIGGFFVSLILTSQFGIIGAAVAAVLIEISGAAQFMMAVRTSHFPINFWNIIRIPLAVGLGMALVFVVLEAFTLPVLPLLILAGSAYVLIVGLAAIQLLDLKESIRSRLAALRRAPTG